MLKQRIITGLVLAPLTLACVFFLSADAFAVFCALALLIAAWEWGPLMGLNGTAERCGFVLLVAAVMALLAWWSPLDAMWIDNRTLQPFYQTLLWIAGAWWLVAAVLVYTYPNGRSLWCKHLLVKGVMGLLTLIPAWVAFVAIRTLSIDGQVYYGASLLVLSLLIVWAADVGAYFCGKRFGKRKLMPQVSPNKTLEGFLGGLLAVAVLVLVVNVSFAVNTALYPAYLLVAIVTAMVSAVGDLNESMLKRAAGIKDSGSILPGHGGLLDRIDSLVAAAPVFLLMYLFFLDGQV